MLKTHNLILTYHTHHDLITKTKYAKNQKNQNQILKTLNRCLQVVNDVKRLTDESMMALAICFVQMLVFLSNREFVS